jgi:hypothetical protein
MEHDQHSMSQLFAQLGEADDRGSIERFISANRPLEGSVLLHEAVFWNVAQAGFLREAISDDADWAAIADALNAALHGH